MLLAAGGLAASDTEAAGDIGVVVHSDVKAEELSFADLRKILLGDRQFWSPSQKIVVLVRAPVAPERTLLLEKIYGMSEAQYRHYWIAKIFRAEATSEPKALLSNIETVELIGFIPGAIALVDVNDLPVGMKVLKIDGIAPGEENYPLR